MSGIRVAYSGLVSFVVGLITVLAGLIFTLIVTRSLNVNEYGTWGLISGIFYYIVIIEPVVSYWVTREIARGIESGKTAVLSSSIFSIGGIFAYITISYFIGNNTNVNQNDLFFAFILIPAIILNRTLTAINLGWKPHTISYATLTQGLIQIPTAIIFIHSLHMGVSGVILAMAISYLSSIIVLSIYARDKLKNKIKIEYLRKWLKLFWLPLYPGISTLIASLDVTVFSVITGSVEGLALWSAAMAVPLLITNSGLISRAIYPKLLGEEKSEYLQGNLTQLFYFAIPLTTLTISFARPALFALNPIYEIAVPVVIFTSIFVFFNTINAVLQSILTGAEKVDINENSSLMSYAKSKLFFIPSLSLIQYSLYMGLLTIGLLVFKSNNDSQLSLVIYWSIVAFVTSFPFTIYLYTLVRKKFKLFFDVRSILKYLLTSISVFGIMYILIENFLVYDSNVYKFIPSLLFFVGLGIGAYLTITYMIDLKTRDLVKAIMHEFKKF